MFNYNVGRYGPSVNRGKLKEKLFNKSQTEYFYYGGETFAVAPNSKETSKSGASGSSRLFAPGAKASAAKLVADLNKPLVSSTGTGSAASMAPIPTTACAPGAPPGTGGCQKLHANTETRFVNFVFIANTVYFCCCYF